MKATNIKWELDIPTEIQVPLTSNIDEISDFISDETGFLHNGFEISISPDEAYILYKREWCRERGVSLEEIDEEIGINGECYACFNEFLENDYEEFVEHIFG